MDSFAQAYAKQIHKHFNLYPNWYPASPVKLGDFGYLSNGLFTRKSSLANAYGIHFSKRKSDPSVQYPSLKSHMVFSTSGSTSVKFLAKGEAEMVNGGLDITFKRKNSFFVNLTGVYVEEIEDQILLADQLLSLYQEDKWNDDWVVVTYTVGAGSTMILGSMTNNNSFLLESKTDVPIVDLANVNIDFSLKSAKSLDLDILCEPGLKPLLGLAKIRKKLFGKSEFRFSDDKFSDVFLLKQEVRNKNLSINDFFEFVSLDSA